MEIKVNRQTLDYITGEAAVLERSNPLLEFAVLEGAKISNFKLPNTARNLKALNYSFKNTDNQQLNNVVIAKGGNIIQEGSLQIINVGEYITVSFTQVLNKVSIDYPLSLSTLLTSSTSKPASPMVVPGADDFFCFPKIMNVGYFGSNQYSGYINNHNGTAYDLSSPLVPCFFVKKMFESFGNQTGVKFSGSFFTDNTTDKLVLVNLKDTRANANMAHKDFVPDMSLPQFLKELGVFLNLVIYINGNNIKVDLADPLFIKPGPKIWLDPKVLEKGFYNTNRLVLEHTGNDTFTKDIPDYSIYTAPNTGVGENFVLKSNFSTIDFDNNLGRFDAKGVSNINNQNSEKNSFKLAFFNNGTVTHTLNNRSLKLVKPGVSLPNSFFGYFERHLKNTFEINIKIPIKSHIASQLDFHANGGANMVVFLRDTYYIIKRQRIDLEKEVGDFTLQKMTI